MAKTQAELQAVIGDLVKAIDADVEQDKEVVTAVNALLEKLKNLPGAVDLTAEVDAVVAATAALTSDNAAVQEVLDTAKSS